MDVLKARHVACYAVSFMGWLYYDVHSYIWSLHVITNESPIVVFY